MISPKTIEDKIKLVPAVSDKMQKAIEQWFDLYMNEKQQTEDGVEIKSMNLPYTIANEKARLACLELNTAVYDPTIEGAAEEPDETSRAGFLNVQYQKLMQDFRHRVTPGMALGTLVIKPIPDKENNCVYFDYVMANEFYPITFTLDGKLTQAVFVEQVTKKDVTYTRIETHELKGGTISIKNEAFKSETNNSTELGQSVSLSSVAEWAALQPSTIIKSQNTVKLDRLLVACFRMPEANNIDIHSKLGISAYAPAISLIRDANEIYSSLLWEYEGSELAIDAPRNALKEKKDEKGNIIATIPKRQQRLFREVHLSTTSGDDLYSIFAPPIRDASYLNGLNAILMQIEDKVCLARGTFSQVESEARTATEIKTLKQKTYASNKDIQRRLQTTLEDLMYITDIYASLYNMAPSGEYAMKFEWDDSILVDVAEELRQRASLVATGAQFPEEAAAWYEGVTLEKRFQEVAAYNELKQKYDPEPELVEDTSIPR